jgi:hypothetical protein
MAAKHDSTPVAAPETYRAAAPEEELPPQRGGPVSAVLGALVLTDLVLTVWGFAFPHAWFRVFHDADAVDPQGLLRRCAANWLAFLVLQVAALVRWRREPWWLFVVAGARLGDALTDVACLTFCAHATPWAWVAFSAAGVGNLVFGAWLLRQGIARTTPASRAR